MTKFLYGLAIVMASTLAAGIRVPATAQQDNPQSFLVNGSFMQDSKSVITGWTQVNAAEPTTAGTEGTDKYITVSAPDQSSVTGLQQTVPMHAEWSKVLLRGSIRVIYQNGSGSSFTGVSLQWLDKSGQTNAAAHPQSWQYTTPGWVEINQLLDVPPGAVSLIVTPEVSHAQATAYFKGLTLTAWVNTFKETFEGTSLDTTRWSASVGPHNVNADEDEWFSPDEAIVAQNMLRIHAEPKQNGDRSYESAQISTIGKFQQRYGVFEFQEKLPVVDGAWPAAYLLPWNDDWPPEIDVQELAGNRPNEVINTNHYTDEYGRHRTSSVNYSGQGIDRNQWHTYSVVWEPGEAAWYLDDVYMGTTGEPYDNVSDVPMYITINFAVGAFGGDPSRSSWPQDFFCREAAVYQRTDLPLPLYPEPTQEITLPVNTATLSANSVSPADTFSVSWTLLDGPGPVKITQPHKITTLAYFTKAGMYRFRIKISEGAISNSAQLLVYVNSALGKS